MKPKIIAVCSKIIRNNSPLLRILHLHDFILIMTTNLILVTKVCPIVHQDPRANIPTKNDKNYIKLSSQYVFVWPHCRIHLYFTTETQNRFGFLETIAQILGLNSSHNIP